MSEVKEATTLREKYAEELPYLESLRHEPFSPIGSLYTSVFEGLVQKGLVLRGAFGSYELSRLGREVIASS